MGSVCAGSGPVHGHASLGAWLCCVWHPGAYLTPLPGCAAHHGSSEFRELAAGASPAVLAMLHGGMYLKCIPLPDLS